MSFFFAHVSFAKITVIRNSNTKHTQKKQKNEIQLTEGSAEMFGYRLQMNETMSIHKGTAGIFTNHGCTIELDGKFPKFPKILENV